MAGKIDRTRSGKKDMAVGSNTVRLPDGRMYRKRDWITGSRLDPRTTPAPNDQDGAGEI
jgi:hypothetical protein